MNEITTAAQAAQHQDDAAVDAMAAAMKAKLAKQRAKGYDGWDTDCTQERLTELLRAHVDKGDPVDVANFCAFLFARNKRIAAAPQAVQPKGEAIAEITSAGHDEAEFGERAIKLLRDFNHLEYGTKLYAGAPPAAQGLDAQTVYEAERFRWLRDKAIEVWRKGPVVFMTDADGCPGENDSWSNNILTGAALEKAIPVAAQAKQGGV